MTHSLTDSDPFEARRRAERLADARIDAERGDAPLTDEDAAWLEEQLAHDRELASAVDLRARTVRLLRAQAPLEAPTDFGDGVMRSVQAGLGRRRSRVSSALVAVMATAAGLGLFLLMTVRSLPHEDGIRVSSAGSVVGPRPADFVVRTSDLGPAAVRAQLSAIADAHGGEVFAGERSLVVRLPRAALVAVLRDLARRGRFTVRKVSQDDLPADQRQVLLRVELD